MLAAINTSKYPLFDRSEIVSDPDLAFRPYQSLSPLKAGNVLPDFPLQKENSKWQQFFKGDEIQGPVLYSQFLNKPLVIGFYSHHWQQYGLALLEHLNAIQHDINASGGSLLIVNAGKDLALKKTVYDNHLSLSFYFDKENEIAEKFNIYSEADPIWNKFSGIDTNVPLLATYVISASGQIEYDHIDPDFSKAFPSKEIVSAVKRTGATNNIRKISSRIR